MPTYVTLINWTDEGIRTYQETVNRSEAFKQLIERLGGSVKDVYWTLGEYDVVAVTEAPDDATAMASALATSSQGRIRTKTLRALSADEMREVLQKASQ